MSGEFIIKVGRVILASEAGLREGPFFLHIRNGRFVKITADAGALPAGAGLIDESDKTALHPEAASLSECEVVVASAMGAVLHRKRCSGETD